MILVITANTNDCKIYHYVKNTSQLALVKEINHPENKLKVSEITADKEGHYKANQTVRGAYSPNMDAKEVEIDNFAREIAEELNQRRNNNDYERLIVIAPPHMYGLLSLHFNKHVKNLMTNHIQKEVTHLSERDLLEFLKVHAEFEG